MLRRDSLISRYLFGFKDPYLDHIQQTKAPRQAITDMSPQQSQSTKPGDGEDDAEFTEDLGSSPLTRSQAFNLYTSHAFSTWNARGYEFAAVRAQMQYHYNLQMKPKRDNWDT